MAAQWIKARILKRGGRDYRLSIDDASPHEGWIDVEEHTVCLDGSTDRAATEALLAELCDPPVSYDQAKKLLADLRGQVLGQTPVAIVQDKYATFWLRVGARVMDSFIFAPVLIMGLAAFGHSSFTGVRVAWIVFAQCAMVVYEIVMHGLWGQTLGKMRFHVIVRDISERRLRMKQAVLRDIVPLALVLLGSCVYVPQVMRRDSIDFSNPPFLTPPFFSQLFGELCMGWTLIDAATMLTNDKRRALHDYIAGSVVIRTEADANFTLAGRRSLRSSVHAPR